MNISEMTLEQLQDFAIKQQEEINALKANELTKDSKISELTDLNATLQRRNNDLFMKVSQGVMPVAEDQKQAEKTESCEDFARNLIIGVNKQ